VPRPHKGGTGHAGGSSRDHGCEDAAPADSETHHPEAGDEEGPCGGLRDHGAHVREHELDVVIVEVAPALQILEPDIDIGARLEIPDPDCIAPAIGGSEDMVEAARIVCGNGREDIPVVLDLYVEDEARPGGNRSIVERRAERAFVGEAEAQIDAIGDHPQSVGEACRFPHECGDEVTIGKLGESVGDGDLCSRVRIDRQCRLGGRCRERNCHC
jgi:hypothetical protein